jgi:2-polyprenyl-3-methyl-5-hydroxy-6-metoxy-1,4-benzoquinol methylase
MEHWTRAKARVDRLLEADQQLARQTEVELLQGDAVWREGQHPLSHESAYVFDTILALDCAYHFKTRLEFLRQSFAHLDAGGRIGLADICFATKPSVISTFLLSSVLGVVPRTNVITEEAYVQEMESLGFNDVQVDDITALVFPAFCEFLRTQGLKFRVLAVAFEWLQKQGARFVIITGTRPPYHIV